MSSSRELKVILVGTTSVGKTCIIQRATTGVLDGQQLPTLGASYTLKTVHFGNIRCRLQIWDTAGQERYRGVTPMYYRGADAGLIVYSVTDRTSFEQVDEWFESFQECTDDAAVYVVGNKIDLDNERVVSEREGREKAVQVGGFFAEVSAVTGAGIEELFQLIPEGCDVQETPPAREPAYVMPQEVTPKKRKKCKC
jgi:small GTP-binding protein